MITATIFKIWMGCEIKLFNARTGNGRQYVTHSSIMESAFCKHISTCK